MNTPKRPKLMLTLAQLICIVAVLVVLFFFFTPVFVLFTYAEQAEMLQQDASQVIEMHSVLLCLRDAAAGTFLLCAALEILGLCARVKKASAFSEKNMKALGRISLQLCIAGVVTLLFGDSLVPFLLTDLPAIPPVLERLLLPFTLLVIALMVRAVQVLMRRALTLQEETDLTV